MDIYFCWGILEMCHSGTDVSNLYLPYALGTKSKLPGFSHTRDLMEIGGKIAGERFSDMDIR